jgi:chaperone required for assembly of F1-ATPase
VNIQTRRRFYKQASATPERGVALDERPIRTPMRRPLILPSQALAVAVAEEWQAQSEELDPTRMILTKLANTAIDRVRPDRDRILAELVRFADADLVCYRAESPEALRRRQAQAWDTVLAWASRSLDAQFQATEGVVHVPQPAASLAALKVHLLSLDDWTLTVIHNLATLTGSVLIAIMTAAGELDPESAWRAAHVDEDWQIEQWGEDWEAAERRARLKSEFDACVRFLRLARS